MKVIGGIIRYFLNINTIWGLMILAAFVLCLAQHFLPTRTVVPESTVLEGDNVVTIVFDNGVDGERRFEFVVGCEDGALVIRSEDTVRAEGRPWLVGGQRVGAAYVLSWDYDVQSRYELAVNGRIVKKGRLATLGGFTEAAFDYAQVGFEIALGLVAAMVLFLGLMKVGEEAGIVRLVSRVFHPVMRVLFPDVPKDHPASGAILMNMTTTVLGLGNAATPFGLKAMKELQKLNPNPAVATDSEVMLLGYNTAGFALLPTTLIALRKSAQCSDPFEIIGTCMFAGAVATLVAIIMVKTLGKVRFFSTRAAVEECDRERAVHSATTASRENA